MRRSIIEQAAGVLFRSLLLVGVSACVSEGENSPIYFIACEDAP